MRCVAVKLCNVLHVLACAQGFDPVRKTASFFANKNCEWRSPPTAGIPFCRFQAFGHDCPPRYQAETLPPRHRHRLLRPEQPVPGAIPTGKVRALPAAATGSTRRSWRPPLAQRWRNGLLAIHCAWWKRSGVVRNPAHGMGAAVSRRCAAACALAALSQSPCTTPTPTHRHTPLLQHMTDRVRADMDPATSQQQCGHVVPHAGVGAYHATWTMSHAGQCRVISPCTTPSETANARELRWWGRRGLFTLLSTRYFWVACTRGWPSTPTFYSEVRMPRNGLLYFHPSQNAGRGL